MRLKQLLIPPLMLFISGEGSAANEEQFAAIKELGRLNGIALHCDGLAQTQRMKRALILNLPKRRQLGELFDYETNKSFMKFIEESAVCPAGDELSTQVSEAITELEQVY